MQYGVIAILDALGFKGIWKKPDHDRVISKFRATDKIREITLEALSRRFSLPPLVKLGIEHSIQFFSDTAIFTCHVPDKPSIIAKRIGITEEALKKVVILSLTLSVGNLLAFMIRPRSVLYRGCLTAGEIMIDKNLIMGPAIDEAAEKFELAEGAFVWFSHSALNWWAGDLNFLELLDTSSENLAFKYDVPIKGGGVYSTRVVNPFSTPIVPDRNAALKSAIDSFDSNSLSVELKCQNTRKMLELAISLDNGLDQRNDGTS